MGWRACLIGLLLGLFLCACSESGGPGGDGGVPDAVDAGDGHGTGDDGGLAGDDGGVAGDDGGLDAGPDAGADAAPPPHPTYAQNAVNWAEGAPSVALAVSVDGMQVTASGSGQDPQGIAACSYNFGDDDPPVEVEADAQGTCPPVTHTYAEAGGYDVVLAVWDRRGMVAQDGQVVQAGPPVETSARSGAFIDGCLEAYWWTPAQGGPFPAMVQYTPYRVADAGPVPLFLGSGLAVVRVTNRGQGSSCGASDLFGTGAQQDLLLIAQWLASRPWATGDFCLWGHSGPGIMGTVSSTVRPDGLRCAFVGGGAARFYEGLFTKSGAWWPVASMWVLGTYAAAALEDPADRIPALVDALVIGHRNARDPAFFGARDVVDELRTLDVPILFETSWDDLAWGGGAAGGPYLDFTDELLPQTSAQIVFAGPHPSFDPSNHRPFRVQPGGGTCHLREVRSFLLHHLKGGPAPASAGFDYLYFRLRGGVQAAWMNRQDGGWQTADTWPPAGAEPVRLFPNAAPSGTVASRHDGSLFAEAQPAGGSVPFGYQAAPVWDPVYSSGGAPWRCYTFPDMRRLDQAGVSFTSPPLAADAVAEGPVVLTLRAETGLYDFDWMAMLTDVWPDGSSHRLSSGFVRASLRNDDTRFEPRPDGVQHYTIRLASIANVFQRGHRIRLTLHQVNTTDADPASKSTTLALGEGATELVLQVQGGVLPFEPYAPCTGCDPAAAAAESLDPYKKHYVSGGVRGIDPASGNPTAFAFFAARDAEGRGAGLALATLPGGSADGGNVTAMEAAATPGYHHRLELGSDITLLLRCAVEDDPAPCCCKPPMRPWARCR